MSSKKIGIGITTHNRYDIFKKTYEQVNKFLPDNAVLVVVDDASKTPVPEASFRFETNVGIARAKNKCFELLYKEGCDHIFLFDDDCYPISKDWYKPYIESPEPHLMYIFKDFTTRKVGDCEILYNTDSIVGYTHPRGCMLYYDRVCLDTVGGMNPLYGKWGWEHVDLSDRIFNAGLTTFRYMDVPNSNRLFYSVDEHTENKYSTVGGSMRQGYIERNSLIYHSKKDSKEYVPFFERENIYLTCYFTGVNDPQRGYKWNANVEDLKILANSVQGGRLVVLHDCFTHEDANKLPGVEFIKVQTSINPYFQRWISYKQYLASNRHWIDKVFCVDGTDVMVLREPLWEELDGKLVVGDEMQLLDDTAKWMRSNHPNFDWFFNRYGQKYQLLNAGIIGSDVNTMLDFLREFLGYYQSNRETCGRTDMGLFNYILRTKFADRLRYGREITTVFKGDEYNTVSWFKHK